jgi:hypothetical protein
MAGRSTSPTSRTQLPPFTRYLPAIAAIPVAATSRSRMRDGHPHRTGAGHASSLVPGDPVRLAAPIGVDVVTGWSQAQVIARSWQFQDGAPARSVQTADLTANVVRPEAKCSRRI